MTSTPGDLTSDTNTGSQSPFGSDEQQPALSLRRTTLPRSTRSWSRAIVWSLIGLTTFAALYGVTAKIDSSIPATGTVRPSAGDTEISSTFNTLVERLYVKQGDYVEEGQELVQLRDTPYTLQLDQTRQLINLTRMEYDRIAALLGLVSPADQSLTFDTFAFASNIDELRLRQLAIQDQLSRSKITSRQFQSDLTSFLDRLDISEDILVRMSALYSQGAVSKLELDRIRDSHIELIASVNRARLEFESSKIAINEHEIKLRHLRAADREELFDNYASVSQKLVELEAKELDLKDRVGLSKLRAPTAGYIANVTIKGGEFASVSTPLMSIVPEDRLNVELKVTNSDIGFLRVDQPVIVRIDSFPFTEYGSINGFIKSISPDVIEPTSTDPVPYYLVTVELNSDHLLKKGNKYFLRPGMSVTALVSLGEKPLISLLIDRFSSLFDSAKTIR